MEMRCTPSRLSGRINAISSKSEAHRVLICSALSDKPTRIYCNVLSNDITATIDCLKNMGADITEGDGVITVTPQSFNEEVTFDCVESGSTLRFLMPLVSALGMDSTFNGQGRLPERPISPLKEEMEKKGVVFHTESDFPIRFTGKLQAGEYEIAGNISSQFITGLLFALPLLEGDSKIKIVPPIESKSYLDITISVLQKFGIEIQEAENMYIVKGNQKYVSPEEITVDGDWSNGAFFLCAGALSKDGITVSGLDVNSPQGDKKVLEILRRMGADVTVDGKDITVKKNRLFGTIMDARDMPDLVPIISVLGACCEKGTTHIINGSRLRLKESDRIQSTFNMLDRVGVAVSETDDGLVIWSDNEMVGKVIDSCNDHRIVMSAAILSCECSLPVDIKDYKAVEKSYPHFFEDFNSLGGNANVINDGK